MTTHDCASYRDEIVHHFGNGRDLRAEAREHYSGCVHCMTAVTAALSGDVAATSCDGRGPAEGKPAALSEAARRALAHGRQVLERVFGIGSANGPATPE
jgi:hypothetical protein